MTKPKEAAKAHYRVQDATRDLFNQQVVNLTYLFVACAINESALHVFT
jgi:hypothetical protein